MSIARVGFALLLSSTLLGVPTPRALAQPTETPEALMARGNELRTKGKDDEALVLFKRAAALKETPKARAQIGLAEQSLGLWAQAEADLGLALQAEKDPWIIKNHAPLIETMRNIRRHLADLAVWGTPDGAEVLVNGKLIGTLPQASARIEAEQVLLEVHKEGFVDLQRHLSVAPEDRLREHVELARRVTKAPVLAAAPSESSTPGANLEQKATAVDTKEGDGGDAPLYGRWWFWALVGVAVAGGVTGVVLATRKSDGAACTGSCDVWAN